MSNQAVLQIHGHHYLIGMDDAIAVMKAISGAKPIKNTWHHSGDVWLYDDSTDVADVRISVASDVFVAKLALASGD